jgi:branched-subunit amino acid transport protein
MGPVVRTPGDLLLVILAGGILTQALRLLPAVLQRVELGAVAEEAGKAVPAAAMGALLFPGVLHVLPDRDLGVTAVALAVAAGVALRTRNLLFPVGAAILAAAAGLALLQR